MKKSNIIPAVLYLVFLTAFSSCLKDKEYDEGRIGIQPDKNSKIVEIAGPQRGFYNIDLIATNSDTTIVDFVTVRLASNEPFDKDIQVTFAINPTLVAAYNTSNATNYVVPASGLYNIPSLTVTIPKGERQGYLKLTTRASNLIGPEYALGIQLVSVSDPDIKLSGNYSKQVVAFAIRNKYDGRYSMSLRTVGWAAYGISSGPTLNWPNNIELVTSSANSISFREPNANTNLQPAFTAAGGTTFFGASTPLYSFDPATNKMSSVVNTTPDDGRGRTFRLNPAITNSGYDASTRKIYAAYLMTQNGRPDQEIYVEFSYVGPR